MVAFAQVLGIIIAFSMPLIILLYLLLLLIARKNRFFRTFWAVLVPTTYVMWTVIGENPLHGVEGFALLEVPLVLGLLCWVAWKEWSNLKFLFLPFTACDA